MKFEELVNLERDKQDQKWGEQNHFPLRWLGILMEEVGETATECINNNPSHNLGHEIVQVAAVAKAMYESLERNGWL